MDELNTVRELRGFGYEKLPGGTIHWYPQPQRAISLPHNRTRTQATFSGWVWIAFAAMTVAGCVAALVRLA